MGLWGKKKRQSGPAFSLQDLLDEVAQPGNQAYQQWAQLPRGAAAARDLITCMYYKIGVKPGYTLEHLVGGSEGILRTDIVKYHANIQTLQRFAARGAVNHFSNGLRHKGNHTKGKYFVPGQRQSEIDRAADWVVKSSGTLHAAGSGTGAWKNLRHAMEVVIETRDVTDDMALSFLQAHCGSIAQQERVNSDRSLFYGTTALGRFLLPSVFTIGRPLANAQNLAVNPMNVDDLAVYLMIGSILAHAYGDGNGRSARALYACTQIKNGRRFIPAAYEWVKNQTHEINLGAVVGVNVPDYRVRPNVAMARRHVGRGQRALYEQVDPEAEAAAADDGFGGIRLL